MLDSTAQITARYDLLAILEHENMKQTRRGQDGQ
jgi:hypothetical protein